MVIKAARWYSIFYIGALIPLLVALNNLLYYNDALISYLPVVQKISFLYFLVWMSLVTVAIYYRCLGKSKCKSQKLKL